MPDGERAWVAVGYELFAKAGPSGLKVEAIARQVGKSKSSFYHRFADVECFTELLLHHHVQRAEAIARAERMCKNIVPDLVDYLMTIGQDLFFNRQLRVNRHITSFSACFEQTAKRITAGFLDLWAKEMGLDSRLLVADAVLGVALEGFYLQLTERTFTRDWLVSYFEQMRHMIAELKKN